MVKYNGCTKEVASFSIRSSTVEGLRAFAEAMEISNLSVWVDVAIREKIARELIEKPSDWKRLLQILREKSS